MRIVALGCVEGALHRFDRVGDLLLALWYNVGLCAIAGDLWCAGDVPGRISGIQM